MKTLGLPRRSRRSLVPPTDIEPPSQDMSGVGVLSFLRVRPRGPLLNAAHVANYIRLNSIY